MVMQLADGIGVVACRRQETRQLDGVARSQPPHGKLPMVPRVLAGEDGGSSGAAGGSGCVGVLKDHTLLRDPVDVRGADCLVPIAPQTVEAVLIRHQEDNVGPGHTALHDKGFPHERRGAGGRSAPAAEHGAKVHLRAMELIPWSTSKEGSHR